MIKKKFILSDYIDDSNKGVDLIIKKEFLIIKGPLGNFYYFLAKNNLKSLYYYSYQNNKKKLNLIKNIILNIIYSVFLGWLVELELIGVGYKIYFNNFILKLDLNYSHGLKIYVDNNIFLKCIKKKIFLFSINKEKLYTFVHLLQKQKKFDKYKGKGILIKYKKISLKLGKQRN